ncbi:MAG: hypothetical protein AAB071_00285 [Bacteroidota bacterium]
MEHLKQPLSNVQLELLKIFSTNLKENDLQELKQQLAHFYAKKSIDSANKVWMEKGLSNEIMDEWLNGNGK